MAETILVVDDYPGARYLRSRILTDAGYAVAEAGTGEEALRQAAAIRPRIILLDVNLPDMSGIEVCERLKGNPQTAECRIIQITGAWISEDARRAGLASGAAVYLVEPVDPSDLIVTIETLMQST